MMGTIVVDEQVLPIVNIYLEAGAFIVHAEAKGPMHMRAGQREVRVHDNEGHIVMTTRLNQDEVEVLERDTLHLEFTCRVLNQEAEPM
jgi:hypothetical protein